MSYKLIFLDQGQRETYSLTGCKSGGGSRQNRCGKSAACVPSIKPFRTNLFLQKQSRSSRVQLSCNVRCHAQHIIFKSQQRHIHNCRTSLFQRVATSISHSISTSTDFKHKANFSHKRNQNICLHLQFLWLAPGLICLPDFPLLIWMTTNLSRQKLDHNDHMLTSVAPGFHPAHQPLSVHIRGELLDRHPWRC